MLLETPDLLLELDGETVPFEGTPVGTRVPQVGLARTYRVLGLNPQEVELVIYDVTWVDGSRVVFAPEREEGNHSRFDGIVGRLRLGVHTTSAHSYVMLGQAQIREPEMRATVVWPALDVLDQGAGVSIERALREAGASGVGTRKELFGDDTSHRNRGVATFDPSSAPDVPALAFVLTRVAPMIRSVR